VLSGGENRRQPAKDGLALCDEAVRTIRTELVDLCVRVKTASSVTREEPRNEQPTPYLYGRTPSWVNGRSRLRPYRSAA
jgi:hypothetical protein